MGNDGKFSRRSKSPKGFAMIDRDIITSKAWKELNGGAVRLYVFMRSKTYGPIDRAEKDILKLSYETMQTETGLSRQSIRNNLIQLENKGFIVFKEHGGLKSGGLSSNEYSISQRFLKYGTSHFIEGEEKKHRGYPDRGFAKVHAKNNESTKAKYKNYTNAV